MHNTRIFAHLWRYAFAFGIVAVLLGCIAFWPGAPSGEAGVRVIGVDADPAGNSATSLGARDACKQVAVGEDFDVDVYIQNVNDLKGWDVRFGFSPTILGLRDPAYDLDFFASGLDASAYEGNGVLFLSAGQASSGAGPSGSGVLARVHLHALAVGISEAIIRTTPAAPYLSHSQSPAETHSSPILNAQIAVGQSCSGAPTLPPTPTPPPTLAPTPTPSPTQAPTPTQTVGGDTSTPTFTPVAGTIPWGDANCMQGVTIDDAIAIAKLKAGVSQSMGSPCPNIGGDVQGASIDVNWGDFNCDNQFNLADAIAIMRYLIGLSASNVAGCPSIATNYVTLP